MAGSATALASWRLRPVCLRLLGGEPRRNRGGRNLWVPPLKDRPMLWKELYIERAGTLGRVGSWLGLLLVLYLVLTSAIFGGLIFWFSYVEPDLSRASSFRVQFDVWNVYYDDIFCALIQIAVALRAAVAISAERERGTWDGLLTSPLSGEEIIRGKLWGCLYALRWLILAALYAWTTALFCGVMSPWSYSIQVVGTFLISACMAADGVRISLSTSSATRAMALTIGVWLFSLAVFAAISAMVVGMFFVFIVLAWMLAIQVGLAVWTGGPPMPIAFETAWAPLFLFLFVINTVLVVLDTRVRFDRIAGRMTEGRFATAMDRMIHGTQMAPVRLEPDKTRRIIAPVPDALGEVL